jgi:hypothetical protein
MITSPPIRVTIGEIGVESIYCVYCSADCIVFEIDCRSKYPDLMFSSNSIILYAGEQTLHTNDTDLSTKIVCDIEDDGWVSIGDASRYTVYWVLIKPSRSPNDDECVWCCEEPS